MGQEITNTSFSKKDFRIFRSYLKQETKILKEWVEQGVLSNDGLVGGFEIESWLLDQALRPAPVNKEFLEHFDNSLASLELATFNLEFNNLPRDLINDVFSNFQAELEKTWRQAQDVAKNLSIPSTLLLIGTLPTLQLSSLNKDTMSDMNRYRALNEQIMARCKEKFLHLYIQGNELLELDSGNVMLEATTTSFQIHTQVPAQEARHYYNAALMISAPLVVIAANSPYIFGKNLWNETRIPLFEQSIDTVNPVAPIKRVSFGTGYIKKSILECFEENLEDFCILLPIIEKDDGTLSHLRLHNGTIWRWNRPLLGFNEKGQPHIRIEHRTIPAGPTFVDMIANAAFFYGLQHYWAQMLKNSHFLPEFTEIKSNFYTAARHSFDHSIIWFGKHIEPAELLHNILLPQAEKGLSMLNISLPDIKKYLSIIAARTDNQQTGASWQRKYVALHKCDMTELTRVYQHFQESGAPVHTWGY
ncbi:MAG: glutamate--cysteine ligase [Nitrosomonadaceae bacterium]